jgi:alpha-galactosidase
MLEVGNGGMTATEYRSQFSLWAIMAAPLLIGTDLSDATPETMAIISNREVIAIDQDPLGAQGRVLSRQDGHWVFAKPLENGDVAVALFNATAQPAEISTTAAAVGMAPRAAYGVRDLWRQAGTQTAGDIAASVPAHGTVIVRVS